MPQRDLHHDAVRRALEADGWTVTHDPYSLAIGSQNVFVDLGAERMLAATRGSERIAVEVKSFIGRSSVADLEQALGQYLLYRVLLSRQEPGRSLFLGVSLSAYDGVLSSALGNVAVEEYDVHLVVVDVENARIERWRK
jgi:hypothetical protein